MPLDHDRDPFWNYWTVLPGDGDSDELISWVQWMKPTEITNERFGAPELGFRT